VHVLKTRYQLNNKVLNGYEVPVLIIYLGIDSQVISPLQNIIELKSQILHRGYWCYFS